MIPLTERVEQYLSQRDRFGTGLSEKPVRVLRKLADFATDQGAESLTIDLILSWKQEYGAASQLVWRNRLCHVRCFARWLRSLEPTTEVPPADLISAPRHRPKPYIYSRDEVRPLLAAVIGPTCAGTPCAKATACPKPRAFTWRTERLEAGSPIRPDCSRSRSTRRLLVTCALPRAS